MSASIEQLIATITANEQRLEADLLGVQSRLEEIRVKRKAVEMTAEMLKNESTALPLSSNRYAKMKLSVALLDAVTSFSGESGFTRAMASKWVRDRGFSYSGDWKNFYAAASIALTRLAEAGKIKLVEPTDGPARFFPIAKTVSHPASAEASSLFV